MNERIKELAVQSIANVRFWEADKESYGVGHDELEKFAESILRECVQALMNNKANLTVDAYVDAIWEINEHFGVGE
jgi:predicted AAA+ superfamily ATPase